MSVIFHITASTWCFVGDPTCVRVGCPPALALKRVPWCRHTGGDCGLPDLRGGREANVHTLRETDGLAGLSQGYLGVIGIGVCA